MLNKLTQKKKKKSECQTKFARIDFEEMAFARQAIVVSGQRRVAAGTDCVIHEVCASLA